jgi:hypothetical protein
MTCLIVPPVNVQGRAPASSSVTASPTSPADVQALADEGEVAGLGLDLRRAMGTCSVETTICSVIPQEL